MTGKDRRFPLSLSSVVDQQKRSSSGSPSVRVATPQTATQNAARSLTGRVTPAIERRMSANPERQQPLVSESVRRAMVARLANQGIKDKLVLGAMEAVQRHLFIEPGLVAQAYVDASIPIGYQQTISQPYIVARMIEVLRNGGVLNRVLEIGTGCGYQAAVLSVVATEVYSIERIRPLHELARTNLRPMRIANVRLQYGDGMLGLAQAAPFDGIILAAAGLNIPQALLDQMSIGGRLVAPVGARHQVLQLVERVSKFDWVHTTLEDCHFVPLQAGTV
ncbi:protein-L-isoaspartate(D-aspartate) O-methyltransferase [Actimicrobium antarcticum]|uniref:Protein-L-isoaspartate O-methyltransferase n=1 Tax=Actimicrobium antarcticum TaxID=1051899 RepID=A0ABP7U174_9BURK